MREAFIHGKDNLVKHWRGIRNSLSSEKTDEQHLKIVADFWSWAPIGPRTLDWDNTDTWPDAWQLMHGMEFDESSIALGMFYTLILASDERWTNRLHLGLAIDLGRKTQKLILLANGSYILNLDHGTVATNADIDSQFRWQQKYTYDGKKHRIDQIGFITDENRIKTTDNQF